MCVPELIEIDGELLVLDDIPMGIIIDENYLRRIHSLNDDNEDTTVELREESEIESSVESYYDEEEREESECQCCGRTGPFLGPLCPGCFETECCDRCGDFCGGNMCPRCAV